MCSADRISALPDDVLCHILSFIPTKLSVSTSILARRWRFLWAHVPNLDFDTKNHHSETIFANIVNTVMSLHKVQSINTFRLCYTDSCSDYEFETWIRTAIALNVRNFDIRLDRKLALPQSLFACKTLVDLRLDSCGGNPSIGVVSLPSLKKLHLYDVQYQVDEDLPHLLSGCPVLEELIIDYYFVVNQNLGCLNISSPTIKRLAVDFGCICYFPSYRVKINAPTLRYLKVNDRTYKHISVSPMASLIEADIRLNTYMVNDDRYIRSVVKFLDCLCKVKCLKLVGYYDKKVMHIADAVLFVKLDHLTKLELKLTGDWRFAIKLLESASNLEVLILDVCVTYWKEPRQVPTCLLLHLRTIRIHQMRCTECELNMVKYLLRNAQVLEKMEIFSQHDEIGFEAKSDELMRIPLSERGSKACQLSFY